MNKYLLGIDIGTSACKLAVFDENANIIASQTGDYKVYYGKNKDEEGFVEQKPNEWWNAVCGALKNIFAENKVKPEEIAAVGIDGQSWSAICVDKNGEILFDDPIWMDTRAAKICEEFKNKIGANKIFELCGNPFEATYSTAKIIWFMRKFPEIFKKTYKILQSNGYIAYKLTGEFTQDISQCYGWHFWNMRESKFDENMAKEFNIDLSLLPDVYNCHDIIGKINSVAAKETGLLAGTPVVAGGLDAACGTLGAGVINDGETQEQGGQSGGMSICIKEYKAHDKLILCNHVAPGKYLLQGGTTGGGASFKWLRENLFSDLNFAELDNLANNIEAGSNGLIFLPYMAGERSPIWDPNAKGVFYGLDYAKNKAHFIRATMEGVAYSLLHNIKTAEESGVFINKMYATGGSANSKVWTQIKADVCNASIVAPDGDASTTLGAAILAGVACGMYGSFDEAVKKCVKIKREHLPSDNAQIKEVYAAGYEKYRAIYEGLKDVMK